MGKAESWLLSAPPWERNESGHSHTGRTRRQRRAQGPRLGRALSVEH